MFRFTLNAPNASGTKPVHQVIGEHEAKSVRELWKTLRECDVILVTEYYTMDSHDGSGNRKLEERGEMIVNWAHTVKIDAYQGNRPPRPQ